MFTLIALFVVIFLLSFVLFDDIKKLVFYRFLVDMELTVDEDNVFFIAKIQGGTAPYYIELLVEDKGEEAAFFKIPAPGEFRVLFPLHIASGESVMVYIEDSSLFALPPLEAKFFIE